jgi:GTPase SAR1 family protein
MASDYSTCRDKIAELAEWYEHAAAQRNEATTRLQLIDRLFFDCLGWSRDDVYLEEPYDGQYADYTFVFPRKLLIVEAKKEGVYFELPAGPPRLEQSIQSLLRTTPELRAAMEQVARYCQQRGVPYAAVSNGHQLVVFVASRSDGKPPFEGMAIVFSSFVQMRDSFLDLWNLLSKNALEQQLLRSRLAGQVEVNLPRKLSAIIRPYPGTKGRNPFQSSMKAVSEFILEDVVRARELERTFLKACYCASGALSEYSLLNKQILQARYHALFDEERPGPAIAPAVDHGIVNPEFLAQSFSRRPVLLIGDVGVGKTTFIRRFISDDAAFATTAIAIYIDFGSKGTLTNDLRAFIVSEIDRQLAEDCQIDTQAESFVRRIYSPELNRFAAGVNRPLKTKKPGLYQQKEIELLEELVSNREEHVRRSLAEVSGDLRKQIVIFLDNTDQRTEQDQQAVFLVAQELAERWQAMIYVTLRPETYHSSMKRGTLTGYHPKAFTIAPPRVDKVIRKRLIFGLRLTSGQIPLGAAVRASHMDLTSLEILLRVFLRSSRWHDAAPRRDDLMRCVENLSSGNVRLALDLVRGFFGSGHVDTQKIINKVRDEGGYVIPLHEFHRAIIYGDNVHYDPSRSPIANVFDITSIDPKEHFLQPIVLAYLRHPAIEGTDEGFVPVERVYQYCQGLGFTPEQIDVAIIRCFGKRLIETVARRIPIPGQIDGFGIRPTPIGLYHIQELLGNFTYLDAVVVDTPILDDQLEHYIQDVHTLADRVERAIVFREYLDRAWTFFGTADLPLDWKEKSAEATTLLIRLAKGQTSN